MDLKTVVYLATRFGGIVGLPPEARQLIGKWGPMGIEIYQAVAPIVARHAAGVGARPGDPLRAANVMLQNIGHESISPDEAQQLENAWMDRATRSGINGN